MTAELEFLDKRGNHMRLVSVVLVRRAAQTLSRGETAFWNPRLRRHAGRHGIVGVLFWVEDGRHAHTVLVFPFL